MLAVIVPIAILATFAFALWGVSPKLGWLAGVALGGVVAWVIVRGGRSANRPEAD